MFSSYSFNSAAMPVGATITVQMGATGKSLGIITACVVRDVLATAAVFDASVYNTASNTFGTGSATISGTSSTQANEVIIYGMVTHAYFANAGAFTQASGYSFPPSSTTSGPDTGTIIGGGHKVTTGAGQSAAVTNTTNGSNPWGLMVYGFKAT
jgi:hypothetical protein